VNIEEFKVATARNQELLRQGVALPGMDSCSSCNKPIQSFLTGREELGDGRIVCGECYFNALGEEIESYPLGGHVRRFGGPGKKAVG
jgi:hypothetical protein